jgi:hypothetical protein
MLAYFSIVHEYRPKPALIDEVVAHAFVPDKNALPPSDKGMPNKDVIEGMGDDQQLLRLMLTCPEPA